MRAEGILASAFVVLQGEQNDTDKMQVHHPRSSVNRCDPIGQDVSSQLGTVLKTGLACNNFKLAEELQDKYGGLTPFAHIY